ncbi:MAG: hypothetical protein ABI743_08165 [bacterium]
MRVSLSLLTLLLSIPFGGIAHADTLSGLVDYPLGASFGTTDEWNWMEPFMDEGLAGYEAPSAYDVDGTQYEIDLVIGTRDDVITMTGVSFHDTSAAVRSDVTRYFRNFFPTLETAFEATSVNDDYILVKRDDAGNVAELVSREDFLTICFATGDEYSGLIEFNSTFDSALADLEPYSDDNGAPIFPLADSDIPIASSSTGPVEAPVITVAPSESEPRVEGTAESTVLFVDEMINAGTLPFGSTLDTSGYSEDQIFPTDMGITGYASYGTRQLDGETRSVRQLVLVRQDGTICGATVMFCHDLLGSTDLGGDTTATYTSLRNHLLAEYPSSDVVIDTRTNIGSASEWEIYRLVLMDADGYYINLLVDWDGQAVQLEYLAPDAEAALPDATGPPETDAGELMQ